METRAAEEKLLDSYFETLKTKSEPLRLKLEAAQKSMIPFHKEVNKRKQEINVIDSEIKLFAKKKEQAMNHFKEQKQLLQSLQESSQDKKKEIASRESDLDNHSKRLREMKEKLKKLRT